MTADTTARRRLYYRLTRSDHDALRSRLSGASAGAVGVHRMFFTSYRDRAAAQTVEELLSPVGEETRFSLQYLDDDLSRLTLERRRGGRRASAVVDEAECRALLRGETDWLRGRREAALLDFYEGLTQRMLLPRMLVSCRREVYAAWSPAIQVALHTDLRSSMEYMDFLDPGRLARHTAEQEGEILMSIGYTDAIPDNVLSLLEEAAPGRKLLSRRK